MIGEPLMSDVPFLCAVGFESVIVFLSGTAAGAGETVILGNWINRPAPRVWFKAELHTIVEDLCADRLEDDEEE